MARSLGLWLCALALLGCPSPVRGTTSADRDLLPEDPAPHDDDPTAGDRDRREAGREPSASTATARTTDDAAPTPCVHTEPSGPGEPIALVEAIRFELDGAEILPASYPTLEALTETLRRETRFCRVDVIVHAMEPDYPRAQQLGRIRAESVVAYLVHAGIDRARLHATGLDDAQRRDDRRVEIVGHEDGCPCRAAP
ncbi:MAG: hypothetical protein J0L92_27115 [Deltaproteobacteria bacterium]|nr:hypothetical protein [Deltaproteobacteria bacterium]